MNVLSLFDGISCGQLALQRAEIEYENYFSSEIDKWAIQITQKNYPDTIQLGDIQNWKEWNLPEIDLLLAGSPCQGFSRAGKQLNFDDPRSALFFDFVDILHAVKPKWFLLENVKMKQEWLNIINQYLHGLQPIEIDSALVSAQSRKRLYWFNIPDITQPEDKGMVLSDVILDGYADRDKSYCIDANYYKGGNLKQYFEKNRRQIVFEFDRKNGVGRKLEKAIPILSSDWRGLNRNQKQNAVLVYNDVFVPKENPKLSSNQLKQIGMMNIKGNENIRRVYSTEGKCPALKSMQGGHRQPKILDAIFIRKLHPLECERLQTIPDNYTEGVSNTQRYKMLGNAWTVDVIAHIFKGIKT